MQSGPDGLGPHSKTLARFSARQLKREAVLECASPLALSVDKNQDAHLEEDIENWPLRIIYLSCKECRRDVDGTKLTPMK
jgi:hypothetical protein